MNATEIGAVLARLTASYGNRELTEAESEVWFDYLAPLDVDQALKAVDTCIRTETWFPALAKFLVIYEAQRPRSCSECGSLPTRRCAQPGRSTCPWSAQWPPIDYAGTWGLPRSTTDSLRQAADVKGLPDGTVTRGGAA